MQRQKEKEMNAEEKANPTLTICISKVGSGYFMGQIKEIPAVITQGATVEEAKENLMSALNLYLEDMREDKDDCDDRDIILTEGLELVP